MAANDTDCSLDSPIQSQSIEPTNPEKPTPESATSSLTTAVNGEVKAIDVTNPAQDLTSKVLDFLSNASSETLGACIIGLGIGTWLILGRLGLILIGGVGGVVLHATWEVSHQDRKDDTSSAQDARRRREKGLDVVGRILDWKEGTSGAPRSEEETPILLDFSSFPNETASALTSLTDKIVADYVKWWYGPVLPEEDAFPKACGQTLTGFLIAVSSHLSRKRPADTFLDFLTNSSSIVIVFLSELSAALRSSGSSTPASNAIQVYLDANPSSSLATVLDARQQKTKLKAVADEILRNFVEPKAYACEPVRTFLREILAGVILQMTVTSCSQAEFINDWIIYALEECNTELIEAIDAGVSGATSGSDTNKAGISSDVERSSGEDSTGTKAESEHTRTVSRAEDAMEEAMQEAKRLSELIAAEEAKKERALDQTASSSEVSTSAEATPMSSRDDIPSMAESMPELNTKNTDVLIEPEPRGSGSVPSFTTFDQIISSQQPTAFTASPLTLHNANISIFDDSVPGEKGSLKSKPTAEYLLQVEPSTSQYPGWMIARTYPDFETLHEVLRRISVVSGIATFAERHQVLPMWRNQTKAKLRGDLEAYLRDALSFQRLAESEGMKRFLEKDQGLGRSSPGQSKGGFAFPSPAAFETMGKGMLDVLASAPKGAAGGGKAILGGVTGVFGGGQRKQTSKSPAGRATDHANKPSKTSNSDSLLEASNSPSARSNIAVGRESQDNSHRYLDVRGSEEPPSLLRRQSQVPSLKDHVEGPSRDDLPAQTHGADKQAVVESVSLPDSEPELHLPPPPSEITDDYNQAKSLPTFPDRSKKSMSDRTSEEKSAIPPKTTKRDAAPLNSQEISVAVELFFAMVNELYTLSSAWTLRLTLLNAAKSFLLRPGNPNLEAIRLLLQTTVIDANSTDEGIASHINKIRENALPTEDELKAWPPPSTEEEKEHKRHKARRLLVQKGMPQALTSVMGAAASGEAVGKVFDCLQVQEVARGLVFALILQGVKALTQ